MIRGSYGKVTERNAAVLQRVRALKAEHPFWGYRRVWAHLVHIDELAINRKRVYELMKKHDLLVKPNLKLRALRLSNKPKPRAERPNQWWGIDMTKTLTQTGWLYIVLVLDWYSKKIVGHCSGERATARDWLVALERAVAKQFAAGIQEQKDTELHLMSDNGCQPTSLRFMKNCKNLGVAQAFTSYNNPKGNADTERMMRTLKEELVWLREWSSPSELSAAFDAWVDQYNETYLHSALGYQPPNRFEQTYNSNNKGPESLLRAA